MKAEEAKKLVEIRLNGDAIEPYLEIVYNLISRAARNGKISILQPFLGMRIIYPSAEKTKAIYKRLEEGGYQVIHHSDPDPRDPRSSSYTEISWK